MSNETFYYFALMGLMAQFLHGALFHVTALMKKLGSDDYAEAPNLNLRKNTILFALKLRRTYLGYTTLILIGSMPIIYQVSKDHQMFYTAIASIYFTIIVLAFTIFATVLSLKWEDHRILIEILVSRLHWTMAFAGWLLVLMFMKFATM